MYAVIKSGLLPSLFASESPSIYISMVLATTANPIATKIEISTRGGASAAPADLTPKLNVGDATAPVGAVPGDPVLVWPWMSGWPVKDWG